MRWSVLTSCVFAVVLVLNACSTAADVTLQPLRSDVVASYRESGLSEDVASCVVGLGERQVELRDLDPATPTPPETQEMIDEIVLSCVEAEQLSNPSFDAGPTLAFASEPDVFGDDKALDELWLWCEAGDGEACDELWETAPVGSTYEKFGVTCGERFDLLDCSDELELVAGTTIDRTLIDPPPEPEIEAETEDSTDQDRPIGADSSVESDSTAETDSTGENPVPFEFFS